MSVRVTPLGRVDPEARVMAGVGVPVVVTGKVKAVPDGTVSLFALVKAGAPGGGEVDGPPAKKESVAELEVSVLLPA